MSGLRNAIRPPSAKKPTTGTGFIQASVLKAIDKINDATAKSKSASASAAPIAFVDPNEGFEFLPTHWSQIKFDENDPLNPEKNDIYPDYSEYTTSKKSEGTGKSMRICWYKDKQPREQMPNKDGKFPVSIHTVVSNPSMVMLYPAGNYAPTNPGFVSSTDFNPLAVDPDKIEGVYDMDGHAPYKEQIDPNDKAGRDRNFLKFIEWGNNRMDRWVANVILLKKEIKSKQKSQAKTMFASEPERALKAIYDNRVPFAPLKKDKRPATAAAKDSKDEEVEIAPQLMGKKMNTERIYCKRRMFMAHDDKKAEESANSIANEVHRKLYKDGWKLWDINFQTIKFVDGSPWATNVAFDKRPFQTCTLEPMPKGMKKPVPVPEEKQLKWKNLCTMPILKLEYYIDSVQGNSYGYKHPLDTVLSLGYAGNNPRPEFGARPALKYTDEQASSEKAKRFAAFSMAQQQMYDTAEREEEEHATATTTNGGGEDEPETKADHEPEPEHEPEQSLPATTTATPPQPQSQPIATPATPAAAAADATVTAKKVASTPAKKPNPKKRAAAAAATEDEPPAKKSKKKLSDADLSLES